MSEIHVRAVPRDELLDLRNRVLRPGLPRTAAYFPGDDLATTRHYAAFLGAASGAASGTGLEGEQLLGCASFMASELDGEPAWQLRAMATDPSVQGRGLGRTLLERAAAEVASDSGVRQFWCNARTRARGFYEKLGWVVCSAEFDIEGVGPHFKMRWVSAPPTR